MRPPATERPNCSPSARLPLAGVEIEPGSPEPADREIFESVSDLEDPQRLAGELLALILRRARELELEGALARVSEAGAAEIGP